MRSTRLGGSSGGAVGGAVGGWCPSLGAGSSRGLVGLVALEESFEFIHGWRCGGMKNCGLGIGLLYEPLKSRCEEVRSTLGLLELIMLG